MSRTIKEATVKRYHYDCHEQIERHLADFINAYNHGRRLKTLKGLTPYEYSCKVWKDDPKRFNLNLRHQMPGLNTCPAVSGLAPSASLNHARCGIPSVLIKIKTRLSSKVNIPF